MYIIMSSCHIIIEENKILRPQTYNIRVLWQCNVGKTCEGVCEDPSTQASKHCTAIPSFVCKIVIAKFFYDVASLNFAKEYTILSSPRAKLRALGLLLADGTPTGGRGEDF